MRRHICDTDNPTRPCCWAARSAEFAAMQERDAARVAEHGGTHCPGCGKTYKVGEDHACKPLTDDQMWG